MEIILREVVGAFHLIENGDSQMIADDSGRHRRRIVAALYHILREFEQSNKDRLAFCPLKVLQDTPCMAS
jgi:hypothetical protein